KDNEEENDISNMPPADLTGWLYDGGKISAVNLCCREKGNGLQDEATTKTVKDYDAFEMKISIDGNGNSFSTIDLELDRTISALTKDYFFKRSTPVAKEFQKFKDTTNSPISWCPLFSAYSNGEVSITCDKTLFDETPGTNLMKYFNNTAIISGIPVGIEETKMYRNFGEPLNNMNQVFPVGAWLYPSYYFELKEKPTEKYDSLIFSLTMPIIREHVRDYVAAQYLGKEPDSLFTHRVFKSDCLIKFDWK
ncbi:MAG: hypothetical protein Q4B61_13105, partial [Bacteroidales bacterium]|nr:hypothetical protein [Bacteroidales bacterium]